MYVAIGFALHSQAIMDWVESHRTLSKLIIAPLFFIGIIMQIIPYIWLKERMQASRFNWIRQRSEWSIGIWLVALGVFTIWASPV